MNFLKQPYPYFHGGRELLRNGLLILILSFLFEFLFEPFNVNRAEHLYDYWVIVLVHSSQSSITYLILFFIVGLFFSGDDWKIYKEILALLLMLILIGSNGFFLRALIYDNPNNGSLDYYLEEVRNTTLVGSVIVLAILSINFRLLNQKNQSRANRISPENLVSTKGSQCVKIKASISVDHFDLELTDLICVKSDGNYLEFFVKDGASSQKLLKRLTLQSALKQLADYPNIVKTHRAFMVNIDYLQRVTGNAQGYQLFIKNLDFTVPVSRGHVQSFGKLVE